MIFLSFSLWTCGRWWTVSSQPVSRLNRWRVLSSGFSCLVTDLEVCCDSDHPPLPPLREERYYQSLASHCQWARSIPHYYSPPTLHHHTTCHGHQLGLSAVNLKVCIREGVSVIHLFIYLFLILLPFNHQIWWFHHPCMLGIFYFSYWIQCNKMTYGQWCSS